MKKAVNQHLFQIRLEKFLARTSPFMSNCAMGLSAVIFVPLT